MSAPLSPNSWQYRSLNALNPGLSFLSDGLIELVEAGHPVVAGSADLQYSNGLNKFARAFPDRYIQFGISEQNMVTASAGLATCGLTPFVASFASFLALLCCEQIRMDVAYSALPVRLIGHHTGISLGFYGTSHHATEDIATMRSIADLSIVSPADGPQLKAAIRASATHDRPIYFRISRGRDPIVYQEDTVFEFGKAVEHLQGEELTIIACGMAVHGALEAATRTEGRRARRRSDRHGVDQTTRPRGGPCLGGAHKADDDRRRTQCHRRAGAAVAEVLADEGAGIKLRRHGIYDEYSLIAPPTHLYAHYKLDAAGIKSVALDVLNALT